MVDVSSKKVGRGVPTKDSLASLAVKPSDEHPMW